jgi:hypothetical protein
LTTGLIIGSITPGASWWGEFWREKAAIIGQLALGGIDVAGRVYRTGKGEEARRAE